jgi:integrase
MARIALAPGEHGEIQISRQSLIDGKWRLVPRGGDRVRARVKYKDHSGTYSEITAFGKTKKEAEAKLARMIEERGSRGADRLTGKTLLVDAGQLWLERIQRPDSGLSARSIDDYTRTFRRYIDAPGSSLRGLTLAEADDPARITAFLRGIADNHGNGALKQCRVVLRHIFQMAVNHRALKTSPMRDVERVRARVPNQTERDTTRAFTRDERDHVVQFAYDFAEADNVNPRTRRKRQAVADLIAFLAATGVRINEARTLRWEDLDLDSGVVLVRGTKTTSALRRISLAPWLADRLRARAERVGTSGLVFAAPAHFHNETLWDQSNSSNALADVLRDAGYPWATPHTFRHTVVTQLHKQGVPLNEIADWVGHRDVVVTSRYLGRDLGSDKSGLAALL